MRSRVQLDRQTDRQDKTGVWNEASLQKEMSDNGGWYKHEVQLFLQQRQFRKQWERRLGRWPVSG